LILVDALTYNGKLGFDEAKTEPMEFHVDKDRKVAYPHGMRITVPQRTARLEDLGSDVLELSLKVNLN